MMVKFWKDVWCNDQPLKEVSRNFYLFWHLTRTARFPKFGRRKRLLGVVDSL